MILRFFEIFRDFEKNVIFHFFIITKIVIIDIIQKPKKNSAWCCRAHDIRAVISSRVVTEE